jgi:hypothetical protein
MDEYQCQVNKDNVFFCFGSTILPDRYHQAALVGWVPRYHDRRVSSSVWLRPFSEFILPKDTPYSPVAPRWCGVAWRRGDRSTPWRHARRKCADGVSAAFRRVTSASI